MTAPLPTDSPDTPAPPAPPSTRLAWLLFAPPFLVTALHFVLGTLAERWPSMQPLVRASAAGDGRTALDEATAQLLWQASAPVLAVLGGLLLAALLAWAVLRTWGWRRVRPWATRAWVLAWTLAAAGLLLSHANRAALQPARTVPATVLQARPQASSERGPGGALALLTLAGEAQPRRVLLEGADPGALHPGQTLTLRHARGRFWGDYVTGSDAPLARPLAPPAQAPVAG